MIFADSKLLGVYPSPLPDARAIDNLSESTGADIIVSDKVFPPIGDLIAKHAVGNSVFIAITELPLSGAERRLEKFIELGVRAKQFIIFGAVIESAGDVAFVRGEYKGSYREYVEFTTHILSCGAQVISLSESYLDVYVHAIESKIGKDANFLSAEIREYKPQCDGSMTLATVPAIKAGLAKQIYANEKANGRQPVLIDLIARYTNRSRMGKDLCTQTVCEGTRKWFGVPEGWNITLEPENKE